MSSVKGYYLTDYCNLNISLTPKNMLLNYCCRFCKGCLIDYTDELFNSLCDYIAIDWDPTSYYLRFQACSDIVSTIYLVCVTIMCSSGEIEIVLVLRFLKELWCWIAALSSLASFPI